jgi:hypothetical protein
MSGLQDKVVMKQMYLFHSFSSPVHNEIERTQRTAEESTTSLLKETGAKMTMWVVVSSRNAHAGLHHE